MQHKNKNIICGRKTYFGGEPTVFKALPGQGKIVIGNFCSLSTGLSFFLDSNHIKERVSTYPFHRLPNWNTSNKNSKLKGDIIIGNDVWMGYQSSIAAGVTIGDGAIIASKSHVIKDVEPYSIVGGNPAKHISFRFKQYQINELLDIKWWNWNNDTLAQMVPHINSRDIQGFIDKCRENGL